MTQKQRAMQVWSVLALAARNQQILSYSILEDLTGVPRRAWGKTLGIIAQYCHRKNYPPLNVIVVNEAEGVPGDHYPGHDEKGALKILTDQAKVFVYDWRGKAPSEKDPKFRDWESD